MNDDYASLLRLFDAQRAAGVAPSEAAWHLAVRAAGRTNQPDLAAQLVHEFRDSQGRVSSALPSSPLPSLPLTLA